MNAVAALYDRWSPAFVRCAGLTHQTVLLPGCDPPATNVELGQRAGLSEARRALDAGCGAGGPAIDLARANPALQIDAVTLSRVQAELAREHVAHAQLADRITVHLADYHALPFAAATFDAVILFESACYSDPPRLCQELARVLKFGGTFYCKDLFLRPGDHDQAAEQELASLQELWALPRPQTRAQWQEHLAAAGFAVELSQLLVDASGDWYLGTMFELGADGLHLNEFGQQFCVPLGAVPIEWCEIRARKAATRVS